MHGEALVAAGLVPLIEVAWSDHAMDAAERDAIMQAARDAGVTRGSTAAELLSAWLERRPGAELLEAWKGYAAALVAELDEADAAAVRGDIMSRAQAVAEAAGGFLGLGSVSREERRMLAELAAALGRLKRLPARLDHAREFAPEGEVAQGDPREAELPVVAAGPAADGAAVADAHRAGVSRELVQQALGLEALVGRQTLVLRQRPQLVAALLVSLDDLSCGGRSWRLMPWWPSVPCSLG